MYRVPASVTHIVARMDDVKREQIDWVKAVMAHMGLTSANALAVAAGVNPANVQKPLNPNYKGKFGVDTIARIATAAGLRPMEFPDRAGGFSESEAQPFVYDEKADAIAANFDRAIRELTRGRAGRDAWVMRSFALEMSGILPGDVLIVDMNLQPRPKDVVCAQIYQWSAGKAETVFRVYEPPYLVMNSLRFGTTKPVPVDGQDVVIKGVVDGVMRRRA